MKFDVYRVGYQCLELRCQTPADADWLQQLLERHGCTVQRLRDAETHLILVAPQPRRLTQRMITKQPGVDP